MRSGRFFLILLLFAVAGLILFLTRAFPGALAGEGDMMRFVYGISVLLLVGSGMFAVRDVSLGQAAKQAAIWVGIFLLVVTVYSFRDDFSGAGNRIFGELVPAEPQTTGTGQITVKATNSGSFYVHTFVNDRPIRMLIDTGASQVALTQSDAEAAGLNPEDLNYTVPYLTAGGRAYGANVNIETLRVGPIEVRHVRAFVLNSDAGQSLLGMTFLNRIGSFEATRDRFTMKQ